MTLIATAGEDGSDPWDIPPSQRRWKYLQPDRLASSERPFKKGIVTDIGEQSALLMLGHPSEEKLVKATISNPMKTRRGSLIWWE